MESHRVGSSSAFCGGEADLMEKEPRKRARKLIAGIRRRTETPERKSNSLKSVRLFHLALNILRTALRRRVNFMTGSGLPFHPGSPLLSDVALLPCSWILQRNGTRRIYTEGDRSILKNWLTVLWGRQT